MTSDDELLRAFEPIIRYTGGELFFPTAVEAYLAECDLLVGSQQGHSRLLARRGSVDTTNLADQVAPPGETLFLRLVQEPLGGLALAQWSRRPGRPVFRAPGRLARVGLFARLIDAGFNASLLIRGKVPGGTAAAASVKYEAARARDPRYVYHGRVVRRDGWIVLHYLYLLLHERLAIDVRRRQRPRSRPRAGVRRPRRRAGRAAPGLVRLRRPRLQRATTSAGAGTTRTSPSSAITRSSTPGPAPTRPTSRPASTSRPFPLPAFRGLRGMFDSLRHFWRDTLRQGDPGDLGARFEAALSIPFIDYARGDGMAIGPGRPAEWTLVPVDDGLGWVDGYRGLWGLDTRDRFAGERAPAGPKYTRTGTVRQSWNDPIGFLGLDKVAPPHRVLESIDERLAELDAEGEAVDAEIATAGAGLAGRDQAVKALAADGSFEKAHLARAAEVTEREADLARLRARRAELGDERTALVRRRAQVVAGERGDPRAHLRHASHPQSTGDQHYGRLVEFWSAISVGIGLIALIALLYLTDLPAWSVVLLSFAGYFVLEAAFRRQLIELLLRITLVLALVGAVVLLVTYATQLVVAAIVGIAIITLVDNVREIRAS